MVEVWEECDCGLDPDICEEQCCIPPGDKLGRQPCKRTPGVQCSPSEGNLKVVWGMVFFYHFLIFQGACLRTFYFSCRVPCPILNGTFKGFV